MNKELEEVTQSKYPLDIWTEEESLIRKLAFTNGAKWMQEQMFKEQGNYPNFEKKSLIPSEVPKQTDENGKPLTFWGGLKEPKQQIAITKAIGEKTVKYLEKYKGQSIYNEIALAIEFGYQLKVQEDE
jgi:hypothetical protein